MSSSEEVVPLTTVAAVYAGYDSVNGNGRSTSAVTGTLVQHGGVSGSRIRVCASVEEVCQALGIGWSLGAAIPGFGGATRKSQFVRSRKITTYSLSIVVYSYHTDRTQTATESRLRDGVAPPSGDPALVEFFYAYGDSFITSLTTGSEYYGMYVLYAQTVEEQRGLESSLRASGIYNGVELSAELQKNLNSSIKSVTVNYTFDQEVSGIANPSLPAPDQMITYAMSFPSIPVSAPVVLGFESDGYEHLAGIGTSFNPIANTRRYFIGDAAVAGLTRKESQVKALDDQLGWLRETYAFYGGYTDPKVNEVKAMTEPELAAIASQKSAYQSNPIQSFTEPPLPSLTKGTPALAFTWTTSNMGGAGGGGPFDDVPSPHDYIMKRTRIRRVALQTGSLVDRLSTTYLDQNGETTLSRGGTGGGYHSIDLTQGQFVTRVTGKSGSYMDSITIFITGGNSVSGGGGGGGPYEVLPTSGHFVLGFRGRCGPSDSKGRLDAIQLVCAQFKPATWST